MPIRNLLIRIAANGIYLLRLRTLRASSARFLVFTGTSGKTLARTASAYALRQAGLLVVSPPYGYTNELGIVLAALGIESIRLLSLRGIWRVMTSQPKNNSYLCIEIGADWRVDTSWFLKRFEPYGVCITNVSTEEWTRPLSDIWKDKKELIGHVLPEGFVVWSAQNESMAKIQEAMVENKKVRALQFSISPSPSSAAFEYKSGSDSYLFSSPLASLAPYTEAFGFAISCLRVIDAKAQRSENFFSAYHPPAGRLSQTVLAFGAMLIADTYKAVPQCTRYVLDLALGAPAKKRIAVVSAMHPLWRNRHAHYKELASILAQFDTAYLIGPAWAGDLVRSYDPRIILVKDMSTYAKLAATLAQEIQPGTTIVIKGAGRYHLERLVNGMLYWKSR